MNAPPPFPAGQNDVQRRNDNEHLHLLSVFHFIGAGLSVLAMGFLVLHYTIMNYVFSNPDMWKGQKNPPPPELFHFLIWFYVAAWVFLLVFVVLNILSGFYLRQRRNRMFSLVVGGLNCIHVPLGTALGVFTIMVLSRESVRDLYRS
jgi:hypothetical protein